MKKTKDILYHEKIYRLFKIRIKLLLDSIKSKKSFEQVLEANKKKQNINIEEPKTFDDKIWYMKKHFYSSLAAKCADKVSVRDYAKECGLEEILVPVYGIYENASEIDFDDLPDECYIKCNHTSGCNYLYKKGHSDERWLKKLFSLYLKRNYYNLSKEWVYRDMLPRIIAEKKLETKNEQSLKDYKMFCFDGKVEMVIISDGSATKQGEHAKKVGRSFYMPDFQWIPEITILNEAKALNPHIKPKNWDRMVSIAQRLSKPFEFCRVDLYNIDGEIYLGEMTFFPSAGVNMFQPHEWAVKLGEWIDLDRCKKNPNYEYKE